MRTKIANWTRLTMVVVVIAGTQAGCKSGWKMPGSEMFSWSRKPNESSLAGSSPSLSMPSSPAQRNTPSPLSNTAGNPSRGLSPYNATSNSTNGPTPLVGGGTVAANNGYSNGPYGMVGQARTNAGIPSGMPTGTSNGYVANTPAGGFGPNSAPTNNFANTQQPALPSAYGGPSIAQGYGPGSAVLNNSGSSSIPAMPAGYNANAYAANPGTSSNGLPPSSMPNALPGGYQPSMPTASNNNANAYRPGSVARTSGYDFSNQGPGSMANASLPPAGLPSSVPATANSLNNPSQLPGGMYR